MRRRLSLTIASMALAATAVALANDQEEQDQNGGLLIFEITRILATKPALDAEVRVALGASLEYLFIQLQRSKTMASRAALARTVVLRLDAGGAESRTEAILAKGRSVIVELNKVQTEYQRLCAPSSAAAVCRSREDFTNQVGDLKRALLRPPAPSK